MDCKRVGADEIAERYLLGTLTEQDRDAFESHFFECDRCFDELRTLRSLQAELQQTAPTERAVPAPIRRRVPARAWAAATVLVIVIGAGFWTLGRINEAARVQTTKNLPTAAPQPSVSDRADVRAARVAELARVEPPPYIPLTVRSAEDWRVRFERAMAEYSAARYVEAARGLEALAAQKPSAANAWFYLGVCYLMLDRTDEAIRALQRCIDARDAAYAEDAQFFLAKAFLGKGDREAATSALDVVSRSNGPRAPEARNLQKRLAGLNR